MGVDGVGGWRSGWSGGGGGGGAFEGLAMEIGVGGWGSMVLEDGDRCRRGVGSMVSGDGDRGVVGGIDGVGGWRSTWSVGGDGWCWRMETGGSGDRDQQYRKMGIDRLGGRGPLRRTATPNDCGRCGTRAMAPQKGRIR